MRTLRFAMPAIAAALFAAGCALPSSTVKTTAATTRAAAAGAAAAHGGTKPAGLGDTIDLSGFNGEQIAVTPVKVVDPATGSDEFNAPDAGKRFYAVQVRIVNTGKVAYSDSPDNCVVVKDGAGQQFQTDLSSVSAGPGIGSVNLAAGDTALGFVVFQVPAGDKVSRIEYTIDSGMGSGSGEWTVG